MIFQLLVNKYIYAYKSDYIDNAVIKQYKNDIAENKFTNIHRSYDFISQVIALYDNENILWFLKKYGFGKKDWCCTYESRMLDYKYINTPIDCPYFVKSCINIFRINNMSKNLSINSLNKSANLYLTSVNRNKNSVGNIYVDNFQTVTIYGNNLGCINLNNSIKHAKIFGVNEIVFGKESVKNALLEIGYINDIIGIIMNYCSFPDNHMDTLEISSSVQKFNGTNVIPTFVKNLTLHVMNDDKEPFSRIRFHPNHVLDTLTIVGSKLPIFNNSPKKVKCLRRDKYYDYYDVVDINIPQEKYKKDLVSKNKNEVELEYYRKKLMDRLELIRSKRTDSNQ